MTTTLAAPTSFDQKIVTPLLGEAKIIFGLILDAEYRLKLTRDQLLSLAFKLGRVLTLPKDEIGHGKWLTWLEGHLPKIGERNAQRCMALYRDNQQVHTKKSVDSTDLSVDSVRKFFWYYIPAKERPTLDGDGSVMQQPHYLSFVNHFVKWDRQLGLGHVPAPPIQQFRREMETPLKRIIEIGGKDWVQSLIESL
jgi:hypothetical protein